MTLAKVSLGGLDKSFDSMSGVSSMLQLSKRDAFQRPYVQSSLVYSCIDARARAVTSVPGEIWTGDPRDPDSRPLKPEEDDIAALFEQPNPLMDRFKFQRALSVFQDLSGGTFLFLNKLIGGRMVPISPGEVPDEIWPVREDLVSPVMDDQSALPVGWKFATSESDDVEYPVHAVAHIYSLDPNNPLRGTGPMQAVYRRAQILFKSEAHDMAMVDNGAEIGGILSNEGKTMGMDQLNRLNRIWRETQEQPRAEGKTAILPGGLKFTRKAFSPQEMQWVEMREWGRTEVMMAFGIHKMILGISDDVNRANAREGVAVFYQNTIRPHLTFFEHEWRRAFFSVLNDPKFRRYHLKYDFGQVPELEEDVDKQIERAEKLMGLGATWDEAVKILGWAVPAESMKLGAKKWISVKLKPLDEEGNLILPDPVKPIVPVPDEEDPADVDPLDIPAEGDDKQHKMHLGMDKVGLAAYTKALSDSLIPHDSRIATRVEGHLKKFVREHVVLLEKIAAEEPTDAPEDVNFSRAMVEPWHAKMERPETFLQPYEYIEIKGISEDEIERLLLTNLKQWNLDIWGAMREPLSGVIDEQAARLARELGGSPLTMAVNPKILEYLQAKEFYVVEGITSPVAKAIREALLRGMAEGSNLGTLAQRVRESLDGLKAQLADVAGGMSHRAMLIARTETGGAAQVAREQQMLRSGIAQHEWVPGGGENARENHLLTEVRTIGEHFSNGLLRPHDPNAPISERANCRCTTIPIVPDE